MADTTLSNDLFRDSTATELLDLLAGEFAGSLELLTTFRLDEAVDDDQVVAELPTPYADTRVALRIGLKTSTAARLGFVSMPLPCSLVLAGSLLMLPMDELRRAGDRSAPDEAEKEALMEIGHLVGAAFNATLRTRFGKGIDVCFAGCQGVEGGSSPWVPGYAGEPLAIRKQLVAFGDLEPFEVLIVIPV